LPATRLVRRRESASSSADQFLAVFGKPPRLQSCDCERSDETTLTQTFQLVSGSLVNQMLADKDNRIEALMRSHAETPGLVTELFWTALTRAPTTDELKQTCQYIEAAKSRRIAVEDVVWGLLNSHEFLLRR
jgi:hypothetical protein